MSNICTGCEQAINEEYIVDKENFMWHTFCYSSEYEEAYKKELASLDQVDCDICDATGRRAKPPETGAGDMECNGCKGTGKTDDWAKSYPFSEDNVWQFANFCANSGGFTIC